jgi:hypothetical protein
MTSQIFPVLENYSNNFELCFKTPDATTVCLRECWFDCKAKDHCIIMLGIQAPLHIGLV